jgi:hypothetical protein
MCKDFYKDEGRGGDLQNDGSNCVPWSCYAGYENVNGPNKELLCKALCKPSEIRDYTKECVYDERYTHKACKLDEYHDFLKSKCVKKSDAACADHFRDQNFAGKLSHGVCVKDGCLPGYTQYVGKCVKNPDDDITCSTIPPYDNTLYDHYYDPEKGACVNNKNCAIHFYDQGFSGLINTYRANGMFRHACEKGGCMVGYDSDGKGNCVPLQKPEAPPAPCVDQQFTKDGYKGVTVDGKCIKAGCLDTHELVKEKDGKIEKCLPRCADGRVRAGLNCVDPPNQQCLKPNPNRDKYGLGYYENGQPKYFTFHVKGEVHGEDVAWYENGQMQRVKSAEEVLKELEDNADAHIHMPSPSYWPIVLALGLPVIGFGIIYSIPLALLGGAIVLFGCYGWALEPSTATEDEIDPPYGGQSQEVVKVG